MKEIKVIDLLNIIARGEIPKKIRYKNELYCFKEDGYYTFFDNKRIHLSIAHSLNNAVEIIEEDNNKIEKLKHTTKCTGIDEDGTYYTNEFTTIELAAKIDEIIDHINNLEKR